MCYGLPSRPDTPSATDVMQQQGEPQHEEMAAAAAAAPQQHNSSESDELQEEESQPQSQLSPITSPQLEREKLLDECTVCLCVYNEQERQPRSLPCGHTLCSLCIASLLKEDHISCPSCHTDHYATNGCNFPVNYALENMMRKLGALQVREASLVTGETIQVIAEGRKQNEGVGLSRRLLSVIKEQRESMDSLLGSMKLELCQLKLYRGKLSHCLAKHGLLMKELDKVKQFHQNAMRLLMEEDLRVEAFIEEGEKDQNTLHAAQTQLDGVSAAQQAFPSIDAADHCAVLAEEWLQQSKQKFPNGSVYSTSCRVVEVSEAAVQVAMEDVEDSTKSITPGHTSCTIMEVLKKIHERSVELGKQHLEKTLKKVLQLDVSSVQKDECKSFSFPFVTSEGDKTPSPCSFSFKIGVGDEGTVFPTPKFVAQLNKFSSDGRSRVLVRKKNSASQDDTRWPSSTPTTTMHSSSPTTSVPFSFSFPITTTSVTSSSSIFGTPTVTSSSSSSLITTPTVTSSSSSSLITTPTVTSSSSSLFGIPTVTSSSSSSLITTPTVTSSSSSSIFGTPTVTSSSSSLFGIPTVTSSSSSSLITTPTVTSSSSSSLITTPTVTSSSSSLFGIPTVTSSSYSSLFDPPTVTSSSSSIFGPLTVTSSSSSLFGIPTVTSSSYSSLFGITTLPFPFPSPITTPTVTSSSSSSPITNPTVTSSSSSSPITTPTVTSSSSSSPITNPTVTSSSSSSPITTPIVTSSSSSSPPLPTTL